MLSKKVKHLSSSVNQLTTIPTRNRVNNNFNNFNNFNFNGDANNLSLFFSTYEVTGDVNSREKPAQLWKNQRSLYTLEWIRFWSGSDKPAKHYNWRDRGANRYLYSKWFFFWDLVVMMVNRGKDANEAICSIHKHYNYKTPTTTIIKHLQKERMNGTGYPQFL